MSDFFDSDIIQEELNKINSLQEALYADATSFGMMDHNEKLEHIDMMIELLEKQRVMYARLSLSDDPAAVEMKENLKKSVVLMGFPPGTDMNTLFSTMEQTVQSLKDYIDA
mgnify:FL=1|jgi:hypothetical protein|tara:strand:+ start:312 stop:644 length:333 start_codon:yes stop_codon:yes gene_type:complete